MIAYSYDENTKEYIGEVDCILDPLETKIQEKEIYSIPANATDIAPPSTGVNEVAIFDEQSKIWVVEEDHRGKVVYDINTQEKNTISSIGKIPTNYTTIKPTNPDDTWDGAKWVADIDSEKNKKITELKIARNNEVGAIIVTTSNNYVIDGDELSQNRMTRAISALPDDITTISWIGANGDVYDLTRPDLIEALFLAGELQTIAFRKYATLKAKANLATMLSEIEAIAW